MIHQKWLAIDLTKYFELAVVKPKDNQELMKLLIRCGFELVMERAAKYTLDLFPAVQCFSTYYPKWKTDMESALFYYLNPAEQVKQQRALIKRLGNFLLKEFNIRKE